MEVVEADRHARINRLKWHCRRALLELDLVFKRFWERRGDELSENDESALRELLTMEDHDLWALISGKASVEKCNEDVVVLIENLRRTW